jgi:hypothetical protein
MRSSISIIGGLAVALSVVAAACGSGSSSHGVATAANAPNGTTTSTESGDQAFIDYAHCMRDHGIADYPDPVQRPGHSGLSLEYNGDPGTARFQSADAACKHFIQSIIDLKERAAHNQITPERLQGLIAYSRCMRDHQIPLLDPDPVDGHISFGTVAGIPDNGIGRQDPRFQTADAACAPLLPAGVTDDGTGPP